MQFLLSLSKKLEAISTAAGRLSVWLILVLMLVIVTDVTLRHWFVIGSTKLQELEWHLHGALFLLCLGWAYTKNSHVRIELVSEKLGAKAGAAIEALGCLLFLLPYCAAIIIFGIDYVSYSLEYNEASASATGLPNRWIIKSVIIIGFSFLTVAALARFLESVVYLFGNSPLANQTFFATHHTQEGES